MVVTGLVKNTVRPEVVVAQGHVVLLLATAAARLKPTLGDDALCPDPLCCFFRL